MKNETNYKAAELSPQLISEIKSLEGKLSQQANKDVVIIAYQREQEQPSAQ